MTSKSNYPVIEISKQAVDELTREQKETLATGFINGNDKTFRTVDLWNIQRQIKPRMQKINRLSSSKAAVFLKRSFLFALLYATLLYLVVRALFFEFPFTISEGIELHTRMLLVVWVFLISCKLLFTAIILLETNMDKIRFYQLAHLRLIKNSFLILLASLLAFTGRTQVVHDVKIKDAGKKINEGSAADTDISFLIKMPS
jgi:hypothetical protein